MYIDDLYHHTISKKSSTNTAYSSTNKHLAQRLTLDMGMGQPLSASVVLKLLLLSLLLLVVVVVVPQLVL